MEVKVPQPERLVVGEEGHMTEQVAAEANVIPTDDPERYIAHNAESWARAVIAHYVQFVAGSAPEGIKGVNELLGATVFVVRLSDGRIGFSLRTGELGGFYNVMVGS
jgi:hypothetical protein